jgi:hypothetical protein
MHHPMHTQPPPRAHPTRPGRASSGQRTLTRRHLPSLTITHLNPTSPTSPRSTTPIRPFPFCLLLHRRHGPFSGSEPAGPKRAPQQAALKALYMPSSPFPLLSSFSSPSSSFFCSSSSSGTLTLRASISPCLLPLFISFLSFPLHLISPFHYRVLFPSVSVCHPRCLPFQRHGAEANCKGIFRNGQGQWLGEWRP